MQRGYIPQLRDYLAEAIKRGEPIPKAPDVLAAWHKKPPHGIEVAPDLRSFTYAVGGAKVSTKEKTPRALTRAIRNHTEVL